MICPYCGSSSYNESFEHPYPYMRNDKKGIIQHIRKFECCCGKSFFSETRRTSDKGVLFQVYKQGLYIYKGGL